ncbi:MAG: hypothetical protein FWE67_12370 [Planctomycetaceae bacterium]|nr:hypothetical protein [Planctomycetaceae bacterium]
MEKFASMSVEFQAGAACAVFFLLLTFILLYLKRGIAMQGALLFSLVSCLVPCHFYILQTFVIYFFLWGFLMKQYTKLLVREQLQKEWQVYLSDYEVVPADPLEFTWLDIEVYDSKQRELEELGFHKIRDSELPHVSRAFPETRHFCRCMLNAEGDISADIIQIRVVKPKNDFERGIDARIVSFASEFSDGTFLETANALGINPIQEVEGITFQQFMPDTPLEELLDLHESEIEEICSNRNVEIRVFHTPQEITAAGEREFLLLREDRRKKGGFTEKESRINRLQMGENASDPGVIAYHKEYDRQVRKLARKEHKKKNSGTFDDL